MTDIEIAESLCAVMVMHENDKIKDNIWHKVSFYFRRVKNLKGDLIDLSIIIDNGEAKNDRA